MNPVERAAEAIADDWNPGRDPVLSAMFRDYAQSALASIDVDELAAALRQATDDGADRTEDYARAVVAHLTKGDEIDEPQGLREPGTTQR